MVSLLVAVVLTAIVFDYINGFHDAANAIATVVSTGVLPIRTAVFMAGALNLVGAMTGTAVAKTIASGFADPATVTQAAVLAALIGASAWNLVTWWFGIPSSSSHALVGGLAGAVVAHSGVTAFRWGALVQKVLVPLVVSPALGFVAAFFIMVGLVWITRGGWRVGVRLAFAAAVLAALGWGAWNGRAIGAAIAGSTAETRILIGLGLAFAVAVPALYGASPERVHGHSRRMQLLSAAMMAFSHGSNDAQKSMGIITLALLAFMAGGQAIPAWMPPSFMPADAGHVPAWVVVTCALAIGAGTAAGGRRIIKTMGTKIIRITPIQGFAAETAGTLTILGASHLGIPVSTTHVINAAIMGVGASRRVSAVRWGVAGNIVVAWVVTLPFSAGLAWLSMKVLDLVV
jgi:PiT family inorganic phosphate transporter